MNSHNVRFKPYLGLTVVALVVDLVTDRPNILPPLRSVSDSANAIATSSGGSTVSLPVALRRRLRIGSSMLT